jgi:mannose-6-phosphate isomerase-like protein (cupin superfamily)
VFVVGRFAGTSSLQALCIFCIIYQNPLAGAFGWIGMVSINETSVEPLVRVEHEGQMLAMIVKYHFREPGITFFTDNQLSQQMGFMRHPVGKVIEPHVHNHISRSVNYTQEALFIRRGRIRVDFYSNAQKYLFSHVLESGDVILLVSGGHGFEVLEEVEMIEIKQGPYAGDRDKTRFAPVSTDKLRSLDQNKVGAEDLAVVAARS